MFTRRGACALMQAVAEAVSQADAGGVEAPAASKQGYARAQGQEAPPPPSSGHHYPPPAVGAGDGSYSSTWGAGLASPTSQPASHAAAAAVDEGYGGGGGTGFSYSQYATGAGSYAGGRPSAGATQSPSFAEVEARIAAEARADAAAQVRVYAGGVGMCWRVLTCSCTRPSSLRLCGPSTVTQRRPVQCSRLAMAALVLVSALAPTPPVLVQVPELVVVLRALLVLEASRAPPLPQLDEHASLSR